MLSGITNSSGIATAAYHSATQSGPVVITAIYGDTLRAETGLRLTSTEAETLRVAVSQDELLADGVSTTPVTATVYNEGGQTVANTSVSFAAIGGGTFTPSIVATDSMGRAVATYRSAASATDIPVSLHIAITRMGNDKDMMLRGVSLHATSQDQSLPANGTATTPVRIDLRRSSTFVAIPGAQVQLGTSLGTIPALAVTDSAGVATIQFTAGNQTGTAEIIARFGNMLTDTVHVDLFSPSATQLEISSSRANLLGNGADSATVTTRVTDQRGAALRSAQVHWSVQGTGRVLTASSLTDANGNATTVYVSPAVGSDQSAQIVAQVGTATNSTGIALRGLTLNVTAVSASLPANGAATTQIRAHLVETSTLVAVANAIVYFGATRGTIANTALTDDAGMAIATLNAATTAGTASIYARYGNLLTDTATVNFYAPTPQRMIVFADTSLLRADGISRTPVHAIVYDETNIAMPGVNVSWAAALGRTEGTQTSDRRHRNGNRNLLDHGFDRGPEHLH